MYNDQRHKRGRIKFNILMLTCGWAAIFICRLFKRCCFEILKVMVSVYAHTFKARLHIRIGIINQCVFKRIKSFLQQHRTVRLSYLHYMSIEKVESCLSEFRLYAVSSDESFRETISWICVSLEEFDEHHWHFDVSETQLSIYKAFLLQIKGKNSINSPFIQI